MARTGRAEEPRIAELRSRLYRRGAGPGDVAAYTAAVSAIEPDGGGQGDDAAPGGPAKRARVRLPPAAAAAAVLVVGVALALPALRSVPAAPVHAPPPTMVAGSPVDGRLDGPPRALTRSVTPTSQRFTGEGAGTIPLAAMRHWFADAHARVTMTSGRTARVGWQVVRIDTRRDWSSFSRLLAERRAVQLHGVPVAVDFDYDGAPPMSVRVAAPAGVRWSLTLELTTRTHGAHA